MIFKIPIPIYKTHVWIYLDEDTDSCRRHYRRNVGLENIDALDFDDTTEARVIFHTSGCCFIRFRKDPSAATVAHEFLHVTIEVLRYRGLALVHESEEAYTYLLAYLVQEFYKRANVK